MSGSFVSWRLLVGIALVLLIGVGVWISGYLDPIAQELNERSVQVYSTMPEDGKVRGDGNVHAEARRDVRLADGSGAVTFVHKETYDVDQTGERESNPSATAVAHVVREIGSHADDFVAVRKAIESLAKLNSKDARTALRRVSLGELNIDNPNLQRWAGKKLISCDRNEAWSLLLSSNPELLSDALIAVKGLAVNQEKLESVKRCLRNKADFVRWGAADALATVPAGKLADEAMRSVCETLAGVKDIPELDVLIANLKDFDSPETNGECNYRQMSIALAIAHVDNSTLRLFAHEQSGRARDAIVLALAERGDTDVRDSIVKLAQDPEAGMFRAWAATALGKIGVADDLRVLQRLAETDPLFRPTSGANDDSPSSYPVRIDAQQAIRAIHQRLKK